MKTTKLIVNVSVLLLALTFCHAQDKPAVSSDGSYQALRNITVGDEAATVSNLVIKRDIGTFTFRSGTFHFLTPVEGKVTGAVFLGDATFTLTPTLEYEKRNIAYLSKSPELQENFSQAVFRFTDGTYDEIKKSSTPGGGDKGKAAGAISANLDRLRVERPMRYNISARILQDVLAGSGGLFYAFIDGHYSSREVFAVDPQGVRMFGVDPEEVAFATATENKFGIWTASHLKEEYASGQARGSQQNSPMHIESQKVDVSLERNGKMRATATTTITSLRPNLRVALFGLFRDLKVESVTDDAGNNLAFIKEDRSWDVNGPSFDNDNFGVILPKALQPGESFTIRSTYGGSHAVRLDGDGNYSNWAAFNWCPAGRGPDFTKYEMTFRVPKGYNVIASGVPVKESTDGGNTVIEWKSPGPINGATFVLGRFKFVEEKSNSGPVLVAASNTAIPDWARNIVDADKIQYGYQNSDGSFANTKDSHPSTEMQGGNMGTGPGMKAILDETQRAVNLYTNYFGAPTFPRLVLGPASDLSPKTEDGGCWSGPSSSPGLSLFPICAAYDVQLRRQLANKGKMAHVDDDPHEPRKQFWKTMTPNTIARQWFSGTVSFPSYRDQWLVDGIAGDAAALFLQVAYAQDPSRHSEYWKQLYEFMTWKNNFGYKAIDAGPVYMGGRAANEKNSGSDGSGAGQIVSGLLSDKSAYIMHMIRMMYWNSKTGDKDYKDLMQDFFKTYAGKAASTEDFKELMEQRHMTQLMDIDRNHRLDWFFDEWVYGTEMPSYNIESTVGKDDKGVVVDFKLTQSGVSDKFKMLVPVYIESASGKVAWLGQVTIVGNNTVSGKLHLGNLPEAPKRLLINQNFDVLTAK